MAEIKLNKRCKYAGDIFPKLIDIGFDIEMATDFLNNIKDADVVEVVRCKNCLHKINYKGRAMCTLYAEEALGGWYGLNATRDEHFCSYGEKKGKIYNG